MFQLHFMLGDLQIVCSIEQLRLVVCAQIFQILAIGVFKYFC